MEQISAEVEEEAVGVAAQAVVLVGVELEVLGVVEVVVLVEVMEEAEPLVEESSAVA